MRIHTSALAYTSLRDALRTAQSKERIAPHVYLLKADACGSRSRDHAFEVALGTDHKVKRDGRTFKNTGNRGADSYANGGTGIYTATYAEWGWWIAELFAIDPDAVIGQYRGLDDFGTQTQGDFSLTEEEAA